MLILVRWPCENICDFFIFAFCIRIGLIHFIYFVLLTPTHSLCLSVLVSMYLSHPNKYIITWLHMLSFFLVFIFGNVCLLSNGTWMKGFCDYANIIWNVYACGKSWNTSFPFQSHFFFLLFFSVSLSRFLSFSLCSAKKSQTHRHPKKYNEFQPKCIKIQCK